MRALAANPAPEEDAGVSLPDAAPVDPTGACAAEDRPICAAVDQLAAREGYRIAAWGTLRLDGSARRYAR